MLGGVVALVTGGASPVVVAEKRFIFRVIGIGVDPVTGFKFIVTKPLDIFELLKEIGLATRYVFMENFSLSDPSIVRALYDRKVSVPLATVMFFFRPVTVN